MVRSRDETIGAAKRPTGVPLWGAGLALPTFLLLLVARHFGYVSDVPLWVIPGELLITLLTMAVFTSLYPPGTPRARPRLHLLLQIALIGTIVYSLGWGSILAVGFIFSASNIMNSDGSRNGPWAIVCIVAATIAGEGAVSLGWVSSLLPEPLGHGLAMLELAGACAVVWIMTYNQQAKEQVERTVIEAAQRFRALVQNGSDMILVVTPEGTIDYASPAFESNLGYPESEWAGMDARGLLDETDVTAISQGDDVSTLLGVPRRAELPIRHRDGSWRWCEATFTNLSHVAGIAGWVANLRDISERKLAAEALWAAHEQFRSAFDNAPIGMGMCSLDGTIIQTNVAYSRILGRPPGDLAGQNIFELTHPDDRHSSRAALLTFIASGNESHQIETRYIHSAGHDVWISLRVSCVRDADGKPLYLIGQAEDISERRALRERLAHAAVHDPLTGLPNRVLFTDRLESALRRAQRERRTVAVMFLDLDHFKLVNDSLGHDAGDRLLCLIARKLAGTLRGSDTLARFGGDEFTVLCEVNDQDEAMEVARRLITTMNEPVALDGGDHYMSMCVGLAFSQRGNEFGAELLRDADAAMYEAKENGPGHIHIYEPDTEVSTVFRLRTSNELHRALERGELELYYQPIVDLSTETMVGLEALVRWNHPTRGLLFPDDFIPLAENSGLIVPLGRWVLEAACSQAVSWRRLQRLSGEKSGPFKISINVSPRQLSDPDFQDTVEGALRRTGLDADQLWLEITESAVMRYSEPTVALMHSLRELGVHFEVDDFGTGYSSLSHLKQLPVETLKVDRSFVSEIDCKADDIAIVRAIIALGSSLGLSVVAEGVERNGQADALRALGCHLAQGYLYGRALPASAFDPFPVTDVNDWQAQMPATA